MSTPSFHNYKNSRKCKGFRNIVNLNLQRNLSNDNKLPLLKGKKIPKIILNDSLALEIKEANFKNFVNPIFNHTSLIDVRPNEAKRNLSQIQNKLFTKFSKINQINFNDSYQLSQIFKRLKNFKKKNSFNISQETGCLKKELSNIMLIQKGKRNKLDYQDKLHNLNKNLETFSTKTNFNNINIGKQENSFNYRAQNIVNSPKNKFSSLDDEKLKQNTSNCINVNSIIPIKYEIKKYEHIKNDRQNSHPICLIMNKKGIANQFKDNHQLKNSKYNSLISDKEFRSNTVKKNCGKQKSINTLILEKNSILKSKNSKMNHVNKKQRHKFFCSSPNKKLNQDISFLDTNIEYRSRQDPLNSKMLLNHQIEQKTGENVNNSKFKIINKLFGSLIDNNVLEKNYNPTKLFCCNESEINTYLNIGIKAKCMLKESLNPEYNKAIFNYKNTIPPRLIPFRKAF